MCVTCRLTGALTLDLAGGSQAILPYGDNFHIESLQVKRNSLEEDGGNGMVGSSVTKLPSLVFRKCSTRPGPRDGIVGLGGSKMGSS